MAQLEIYIAPSPAMPVTGPGLALLTPFVSKSPADAADRLASCGLRV